MNQSHSPMKQLIDRLLSEAPPLLTAHGLPSPNQSPALECIVMFTGGPTVRGSLSRTPEGTLRMMSPGQEGQREVLVEQFFDYDAIATIAILREIKADRSRLFVPAGSTIS